MVFNGLIGIIVFVLDVWAIAMIINSGVPTSNKILWILLVLFAPVIGFLIWYFVGPKPDQAG